MTQTNQTEWKGLLTVMNVHTLYYTNTKGAIRAIIGLAVCVDDFGFLKSCDSTDGFWVIP